MPNPTFHNLPAEKREQFTEIALREFALYPYELASISRIIKTMGIAKGSLYQYFKNKKALYDYLIEYAGERKLKVTAKYLQDTDADFFKWYRKMHTASVLFDLNHPVLGLLLNNVSRECYSEQLGNLALANKEEAIAFYKNVLKQHVNSGRLPQKPNYIAHAYILVQTGIGLLDLLQLQLGISLRECVRQNEVPTFDEKEVKKIIKKVVGNLQVAMV